MSEDLNEVVRQTWKRGTRLSLVVIVFFVLGVGAVYLLTGITGWSDAGRLFVALLTGPIVGTVVFLGVWRWRASQS
ncbi:MAG: hypothetical protein ACLFTK_11345 [Anaerolineales bacterium]